MAVEKEAIEEIKKLGQLIPKKSSEELKKILEYGEKIKAEGKMKKRRFWKKYGSHDFLNLLGYMEENKNTIEKKYKYLDKMNKIEKKKFIEEYLHDDMLYGCSRNFKSFEIEDTTCPYICWKNGDCVEGRWMIFDFTSNHFGVDGAKDIAKNLKLKEGMNLDLRINEIGDEGAKVLSKMKLKAGVEFNLGWNEIGVEGAKAIAQMKLQDGVQLNLHSNQIGDEGAEAISHMILKEGVTLNLSYNKIGDKGAEAIMQNMELKDGVIINLNGNNFTGGAIKKLNKWKNFYQNKGIKCDILFCDS